MNAEQYKEHLATINKTIEYDKDTIKKSVRYLEDFIQELEHDIECIKGDDVLAKFICVDRAGAMQQLMGTIKSIQQSARHTGVMIGTQTITPDEKWSEKDIDSLATWTQGTHHTLTDSEYADSASDSPVSFSEFLRYMTGEKPMARPEVISEHNKALAQKILDGIQGKLNDDTTDQGQDNAPTTHNETCTH